MILPQQNENQLPVYCGADVLISNNLDQISGKRIGLVVNQTSVLRNGKLLIDTLLQIPGVKIKALFSPEHGINGDSEAGEIINGKYFYSGIPVFSLHGNVKKPTKKMLRGIDIILFDLQDVGARFYTYISTLYHVTESAAELKIPIIILDRPNPIGGLNVSGPMLQSENKSFIGIAEIPLIYGMTAGELAMMFNEMIFFKKNIKADLSIIKMQNWKREYFFDDCNLTWIKPSPNITTPETAIIFPGTALIEGTNISEGRGTNMPFLTIGAPFINDAEFALTLNSKNIPGVKFSPCEFSPKSIPGTAVTPKFEGQKCYGVSIKITDKKIFRPVECGIEILCTLHSFYPGEFQINSSLFDLLTGDSSIRKMILEGKTADEIIGQWKEELNKFVTERKSYLIY
ncbi:MAG: DUF1343 domain-containing protein [bacterium]